MRERALRASLGRALFEARGACGFTQRSLAARAGVGEKYLSRIERGLATPSVLVVFRLSRALGVGVDALLPEPGFERPVPAAPLLRLLRDRSPSELEQAERVLRALFR
jgi:transcriptional regulator with XRE-family HTH domain